MNLPFTETPSAPTKVLELLCSLGEAAPAWACVPIWGWTAVVTDRATVFTNVREGAVEMVSYVSDLGDSVAARKIALYSNHFLSVGDGTFGFAINNEGILFLTGRVAAEPDILFAAIHEMGEAGANWSTFFQSVAGDASPPPGASRAFPYV